MPTAGNDRPRYALVTPTYAPDLRRCELLIESLQRIGGGHRHYLIVDHRDRRVFAHLASPTTIVVDAEALIGGWLRRMPGRRSLWLSLRAPPVRGWVLQQILKIAIAQAVDEDILVYCDSDVAFIRRFSLDDLMIGDRLGLSYIPRHDPSSSWPAVARRLLGLRAGDDATRGFVGNMICWRRDVVLQMCDRIEAVTGLFWQVALARQLSFSEYVIYGTFVRDVLGFDCSGHAPSQATLVKPSWNLDLTSDESLDRFFSDFSAETVAVMIHSKDGVEPSRVKLRLERLWRQA